MPEGTVKHIHGEAFCHMMYQCQRCRFRETVWNSRDGVTPFIIACQRCGGEAHHINWGNDRYDPTFVPTPGTRIFRDWHEDEMRNYFDQMVEEGKFPPNVPYEMFRSSIEAGAPTIVTVKKSQTGRRKGTVNAN